MVQPHEPRPGPLRRLATKNHIALRFQDPRLSGEARADSVQITGFSSSLVNMIRSHGYFTWLLVGQR